jgi:hypothetical protein
MITKKYYQELLSPNPSKRDRSKTIEDYFDWVISSFVIGARIQTVQELNMMSAPQKIEFYRWVRDTDNLKVYDELVDLDRRI